MKRRTLSALLALCMILALSACGSTEQPTDLAPLSAEEITAMWDAPKPFKGRTVDLTGLVIVGPEKDSSGYQLQILCDAEDYDDLAIINFDDADSDIREGSYVKVSGTIRDIYSGENKAGDSIEAPIIKADIVDVASYAEAVRPSLLTVDVGLSKEICGYLITVDEVEFAEKETRVYLTAKNGGKYSLDLWASSSVAVQGSTQYDYDWNYDAEYPEFPRDMMPGISASAIYTFGAMDHSSFSLHLNCRSDNWGEDLSGFVFDIPVEVTQ